MQIEHVINGVSLIICVSSGKYDTESRDFVQI